MPPEEHLKRTVPSKVKIFPVATWYRWWLQKHTPECEYIRICSSTPTYLKKAYLFQGPFSLSKQVHSWRIGGRSQSPTARAPASPGKHDTHMSTHHPFTSSRWCREILHEKSTRNFAKRVSTSFPCKSLPENHHVYPPTTFLGSLLPSFLYFEYVRMGHHW